MSWVPKWSSWGGRLSPFTRSPHTGGATKISDSDFSYITADDLRRHQQEGGDVADSLPNDDEEYGPPRDTDVLTLRAKGKDLHIHFPAYSIGKGDLDVGQLRDAGAKKLGLVDSRGVKLVYRGKVLKDDGRTCRSEGLRHGSELMCTLLDVSPGTSNSSDEDEEDGDEVAFEGRDGSAAGNTSRSKKKGKRGGKKAAKRKARDAASSTPTGTGIPGAGGVNVPGHHQQPNNLNIPPSASSTRTPSPNKAPRTPHEKLDVIRAAMNSYLPECEKFIHSPPAEPAKRDFDHKRLAETILTKVVMQLDGVETEGDEDARARRKALIKEAQGLLADLDAAVAR